MSLSVIGHAQIWDPSNPGREIASTEAQSQWQAWPLCGTKRKPLGQEHYRQMGYGGMNRIPFIPIKGDFKAFDFEQLAQLPF